MMSQHVAYLGLGSNMSSPEQQLLSAFDEISNIPGVSLCKRSSFYRTAPLGYAQQPDFINAVAEVRTTLPPRALLMELLGIEQYHGRVRTFSNAPRTLDIDILVYDDLQYDDGILTLPHPRAHERAFVLYPLLEIAPDCFIPGRGTVRQLLAECIAGNNQPILRIGEEALLRQAIGYLVGDQPPYGTERPARRSRTVGQDFTDEG